MSSIGELQRVVWAVLDFLEEDTSGLSRRERLDRGVQWYVLRGKLRRLERECIQELIRLAVAGDSGAGTSLPEGDAA